ncbi:MAG: hypothetical protein H6697_10080 [Myxococcales bacterium]|nr:hypothetical protein [Myxococcales bacterium]MCB9520734.1 hypothetical protein [Myxococcales bacterium]
MPDTRRPPATPLLVSLFACQLAAFGCSTDAGSAPVPDVGDAGSDAIGAVDAVDDREPADGPTDRDAVGETSDADGDAITGEDADADSVAADAEPGNSDAGAPDSDVTDAADDVATAPTDAADARPDDSAGDSHATDGDLVEPDADVLDVVEAGDAAAPDADVADTAPDAVDVDAIDEHAPPPRDSIDWLSQDIVLGRPDADPYCQPAEREEARIGTPVGYVRTDAAGDEGGVSVLVPAYNPERQRWESRVLTTFDFRPYAESQPGVGGVPNGADVFEAEGQYVSIVGTNDSGGVAGWASSWGDGCQYFDAWISYDRTHVPDFDPRDRGSWASVTSPIEGVSNPTRDNCPSGFGSTTTRWTYVSAFEFAGESTCPGDTGRKVMDTIVSDHDGGNHHEVFYFTDEYGSKSRWERWECGIPYPDHDYVTARCRYGESESAMHMAYGVDDDRRSIVDANGSTCFLTDCRDFTTVLPLAAPGYEAAAWHHGAIVYFSGNVLRNGDFHSGDEGWDSLGTAAELPADANGNHYLRVSATGTGWHSVLGSSIDEFNRLFDADGAEAYLPKYLHWGARIRHAGGGGTARMAIVEWGNPGGEVIDERALSPSPEWQFVSFHRLLGAATNRLDVRFRLDGLSDLEVDDVYVYISNDPAR